MAPSNRHDEPALVAALTAIAVPATAAAGCGAPARPRHAPAVVLTASQVAALRSYGTSDTAFGLNLLSSLCASRPAANAVISPVSLATGLAMTYLGGRGATTAAVARVLHWPAASGSQVAGLCTRSALLRSLDAPGVTFTASNRIWADPSPAGIFRRCSRPARCRSRRSDWVLTDALYLNARWKHPFSHALTQPGSFATPTGPVTASYLMLARCTP